jgi:hypothetical protein
MSTYCWVVKKSLGMLCVGWGPWTGLFWELKAAHSAGPKLPEQPHSHSTSLPRLNEWFIWEQRMATLQVRFLKMRNLTQNVPSSVEADILLRVGCPPHTLKTFSNSPSCYTCPCWKSLNMWMTFNVVQTVFPQFCFLSEVISITSNPATEFDESLKIQVWVCKKFWLWSYLNWAGHGFSFLFSAASFGSNAILASVDHNLGAGGVLTVRFSRGLIV